MNKKNTENYLENKGCGFTQISNKFIQNNKISNTAKAVYIYMASRPDGWEFHVNEIRNNVKSGREAINNAMNELIDFGYLIKSQIRCKLGKFNKNHYKILYQPLTENPLTENPLTVEPLTENQTLNNTDINNTDINNKKKKYIKKDGVLDTLPFSDQNELQGNLSKHSEIEPSFPETKGKSPKADKVIAKADKVMVSRDTKRIDDDLGNAGISLEVWEGYREMRKKMKKPLTDRAVQLAIKKAVSLSVKCRCAPDDIIDQSTMNGWLGLFEIKTITTTYGVKQNATIRQNTNPSPAERGREANQKYLEELEQRASGYINEMESEGRSYGC